MESMEYLNEWLILVVLQFFALASPGPDFVIAVRNSVVYSRKAGIYTAIGFATGAGIHVMYCLIGLAAIITQSIMIFNVIKYIGAGYLIYIGVKTLLSRRQIADTDAKKAKNKISNIAAYRSGFITNLFNPKATMFYLALFTQVIEPSMPTSVQILYLITCVSLTAGWYSFVALVLTNPRIKQTFLRFTKTIDRICGSLMIALGLKIAFTK